MNPLMKPSPSPEVQELIHLVTNVYIQGNLCALNRILKEETKDFY